MTIHDFLPRHYAGSELYTYYLCKELIKNNEVTLLFSEYDISKKQYSVRKIEYDGLSCIEITNNHFFKSFEETYNNFSINEIFKETIQTFKPNVIHLQHLMNLSTNFLQISRKYEIPTVITLHDFWLMCPRGGQRFNPDHGICYEINPQRCARCFLASPFNVPIIDAGWHTAIRIPGEKLMLKISQILNRMRIKAPGVTNWFYRKLKKLLSQYHQHDFYLNISDRLEFTKARCQEATLVISPSKYYREQFIQFGISPDKIIHSDNGFVPRQPFHNKQRNKMRFGFIGTLVEHKGVHLLINAFNEIPPEKCELVIYGDPEVFPDYSRRLMRSAKGKNIYFKSKFENFNINKILSEIDVLVVPSIWLENSPLTIHEAQMLKVPVVASRLGGIPELVEDGRNGFLFNPDDTQDLKRKIIQLVENPELLNTFKQNMKTIKSIAQNAQELEQIYHSL
ncbi:MAG: glycosyltransferase family 4 protein [Proteobacteria bacterium]|nr:glycosyltransferase family 4 protein [Pseudomonadota bacterium]